MLRCFRGVLESQGVQVLYSFARELGREEGNKPLSHYTSTLTDILELGGSETNGI